mgnify:CR=1 FL=1
MLAVAAISFTSCSTDEQNAETQAVAKEQSQGSNLTKKSALALCTVTSTSVTVNRTAAPSSTYTNWTPVAAAIGGVNVQWEGIYGGSIRPVAAANPCREKRRARRRIARGDLRESSLHNRAVVGRHRIDFALRNRKPALRDAHLPDHFAQLGSRFAFPKL